MRRSGNADAERVSLGPLGIRSKCLRNAYVAVRLTDLQSLALLPSMIAPLLLTARAQAVTR